MGQGNRGHLRGFLSADQSSEFVANFQECIDFLLKGGDTTSDTQETGGRENVAARLCTNAGLSSRTCLLEHLEIAGEISRLCRYVAGRMLGVQAPFQRHRGVRGGALPAVEFST